MFKLEYNRSYAFLFFIIAGLSLFASMIFGKTAGGFSLFIGMLYVAILELSSGISLNRSWVAHCKREHNPKTFNIDVGLAFFVAIIGLILVFISSQ
jgi:hypothetical protein